ncbi:hypothetical protein [Geodermatophilus chilensis]|uniref:hypothetical protein n=1 Tax=Geodermatophilus chilensis TaxID=2035835 RepID=UPI0018E41517|nr:hypothetical protein [Geodermatophilus chilensis]
MAVDGDDRCAELVVVPDVVGLEVGRAHRVAQAAGVALAPPDPDGPPLGALTWPGEYVVTAQTPVGGSVVHRWDSVVVRFVAAGGTAGGDEPRRPPPHAPPAAAPLDAG